MLSKYIAAAMSRATYTLQEGFIYYGEIPDLTDVWADGHTLEACRDHLQGVLESWIVSQLYSQQPIPELNGHKIDPLESDALEDALDLRAARLALESVQRDGSVVLEPSNQGMSA